MHIQIYIRNTYYFILTTGRDTSILIRVFYHSKTAYISINISKQKCHRLEEHQMRFAFDVSQTYCHQNYRYGTIAAVLTLTGYLIGLLIDQIINTDYC